MQKLLRFNKQGAERTSAKSPSLLAGLLTTAEGRKLVPSHAVKKGRRYRYYIEQHLAQETGVGLQGQRYSAHEVEAAVIETLRRFLERPTEVAAALALKDLAPSAMKQMITKATDLALEIVDPHRAIGLLPEILAAVTIHPAELRLSLRRETLQANLGVEASFEDPIHTLAIPCTLARRGQELRFVLPPQAGSNRCGSRDPVLIQAVARAHLWWQWVRNGEVTSFREIATREGLSPSQVTRRFNLAFLSPELVRRIRAGTQPTELTLEALTRGVDLPLDWAQQEILLS